MKLINHHVYQSSELAVAILLTSKCTCPIVQVHDLCLLRLLCLLSLLQPQLHAQLQSTMTTQPPIRAIQSSVHSYSTMPIHSLHYNNAALCYLVYAGYLVYLCNCLLCLSIAVDLIKSTWLSSLLCLSSFLSFPKLSMLLILTICAIL